MMTPPVKPCCSRNSRTMPRRRPRSSRDSILRETPTWSTVGMNTRKRPGIVTCEVSRAPFVPSGSLTTWTRMSCPSLSRSSILGSGQSPRALARSVRAPPRAPFPPRRSSRARSRPFLPSVRSCALAVVRPGARPSAGSTERGDPRYRSASNSETRPGRVTLPGMRSDYGSCVWDVRARRRRPRSPARLRTASSGLGFRRRDAEASPGRPPRRRRRRRPPRDLSNV